MQLLYLPSDFSLVAMTLAHDDTEERQQPDYEQQSESPPLPRDQGAQDENLNQEGTDGFWKNYVVELN